VLEILISGFLNEKSTECSIYLNVLNFRARIRANICSTFQVVRLSNPKPFTVTVTINYDSQILFFIFVLQRVESQEENAEAVEILTLRKCSKMNFLET
jgi:hypothetical protein